MEETLSEGTQLCLHCGLCCKGYFHKHANIKNKDDLELALKMEASIVTFSDGSKGFELPCPKFDVKCTVYPERPSVCENHQCDLLENVKAGRISLEKAKNMSDQMKELCIYLDQALDEIQPNDKTRQFKTRFNTLLTSKDILQIKKNNPKLFLKYALYLRLEEDYFYKEEHQDS